MEFGDLRGFAAYRRARSARPTAGQQWGSGVLAACQKSTIPLSTSTFNLNLFQIFNFQLQLLISKK